CQLGHKELGAKRLWLRPIPTYVLLCRYNQDIKRDTPRPSRDSLYEHHLAPNVVSSHNYNASETTKPQD
ncbi:hypothetical protein N7471_002900, partial [Penicillium samsonianum]|uniref:uncharacterized protein n=1 Tax=Penicillium samsonianum TaxID=1882272 RepID=UPI002549AA92